MIKTAMVFAAGEGRRMRPLTATRPKPLIEIEGKSLLWCVLNKLDQAGVSKVVINAAYLSDQIEAAVARFEFTNLRCELSIEDRPLETGGGLLKALPLLGETPFLLINSDVWTEFDVRHLLTRGLNTSTLAHLVLVPNPPHKTAPDFVLKQSSQVAPYEPRAVELAYTFSGISVLHPNLIRNYAGSKKVFPLRDLLYPAMYDGRVSGELFEGPWVDVGTPERLNEVESRLKEPSL